MHTLEAQLKFHFTIVHQRGSAGKFNRGWGVYWMENCCNCLLISKV